MPMVPVRVILLVGCHCFSSLSTYHTHNEEDTYVYTTMIPVGASKQWAKGKRPVGRAGMQDARGSPSPHGDGYLRVGCVSRAWFMHASPQDAHRAGGRTQGWEDARKGGRTRTRVGGRTRGWEDAREGGRTHARVGG